MQEILLLVLAFSTIAFGQEVIMSQPSGDVVDKHQVFVRSDSFYTQQPAYFTEAINFAYGVGHNLEFSINGSNLAHDNATWQVTPGFKWIPIKTKNFEIFIGDQFWKPVSNFSYFHNGNVSYEAAALRVGSLRFTGGTFQSVNAYSPGTKDGAFGGIEWMAKMFKNGWMVSPVVDYASGSGSNGYTSVGVMLCNKTFFISTG